MLSMVISTELVRRHPVNFGVRQSRDGRAVSHAALAKIRQRAVERVGLDGQSPKVVTSILGFHRSVTYEWLGRFRKPGSTG